jgi:hypothetical protein
MLHYVQHLLETLLGRLPVDNVPDGLEVLCFAVLVLQVVCVLPGIHTQDGPELSNDGVLVGIRLDAHAARLGVLDQPRPPASLDAGEGDVELLLERVQAAVRVVDGRCEGAGRGLAAALGGGREVLPEEGVVDVAAAVEVDEGLQGDLGGDVVLLLGLCDLLAEVVERGHVGVVVVLVVELHDLAADGGLEGAVVVCYRALARARSVCVGTEETYTRGPAA